MPPFYVYSLIWPDQSKHLIPWTCCLTVIYADIPSIVGQAPGSHTYS